MTVCPIAVAVGCRKCPIVRVCPAKRILGNYQDIPLVPPPANVKARPSKRH